MFNVKVFVFGIKPFIFDLNCFVWCKMIFMICIIFDLVQKICLVFFFNTECPAKNYIQLKMYIFENV